MDGSLARLWVTPVEPFDDVRRLLSPEEAADCSSAPPTVAAGRATSRALLRRLAALHSADPARPLTVRRLCVQCGSAQHGRPELVGGPHVSLSRCPTHVVALLTAAPSGVDVERIDRRLSDPEGFAATVLSTQELALAADPATLVSTWTRKEAVLKAEGTGLLRSPAEVDVDCDRVDLDGRAWWLSTRTLQPEGLLCSVAGVAPLAVEVDRRRVSADDDWR